jgi:iron complex outermembrane receptor protein
LELLPALAGLSQGSPNSSAVPFFQFLNSSIFLNTMKFRKRSLYAATLGAAVFNVHAASEKPEAEAPVQELGELVITATREAEPLKETPASVSILKPEAIKFAAPAHPQQILGQVPGVAISVTNGEGHQTAIRQPISTNPLYLFLEDGIGVRPTGFFNHNALYELNIPMAGGIEVTRGPGSALYGSDAIGGVINVLSRASGLRPEISLLSEVGSFGWLRELASFSTGETRFGGLRAELNLTHTDGWRDQTGYDRQSGNLRWDWRLDEDTKLKTIVGYTHIDQETGANSALPWDLYQNAPKTNLFSAAYRKVEALRISSEFERRIGDGLLSLTPYFRDNRMDLNGSYNFNSGDARIERTASQSYGLLSKWRQDFPEFKRARVIVGLDMESSPGSRREDALNMRTTGTGTGAYTNYTGYTVGSRIYDYDVTFRSVSPYVHTEISPVEKLRVTAGARYDMLGYDFENNLSGGASVNGSARYGQSESTEKSFSRLSPKLGATYELAKNLSVYASYNRGFRVPSEGQLFRAGTGPNTALPAQRAVLAQQRAAAALGLQPIKADQFELGTRGKTLGLDYTLAAYRLMKHDDIVSMRDTSTNLSYSENAGKTESRGLEASLGRELPGGLRVETALSYAKHEYKEWRSTTDFSGNEMAAAPRFIGNTRLTWTPVEAVSAQLEWVRMGGYYLQDSNAGTTSAADPRRGVSRYDGHHLLNLRTSYAVCRNASIYARVLNLADRRYADSASVASNTAVYAPGLPRTFYAGLELKW